MTIYKISEARTGPIGAILNNIPGVDYPLFRDTLKERKVIPIAPYLERCRRDRLIGKREKRIGRKSDGLNVDRE